MSYFIYCNGCYFHKNLIEQELAGQFLYCHGYNILLLLNFFNWLGSFLFFLFCSFHLAKLFLASMGYCVYTWLKWSFYRPHPMLISSKPLSSLSSHPLLNGHLLISQGWLLNRSLTVLSLPSRLDSFKMTASPLVCAPLWPIIRLFRCVPLWL